MNTYLLGIIHHYQANEWSWDQVFVPVDREVEAAQYPLDPFH